MSLKGKVSLFLSTINRIQVGRETLQPQLHQGLSHRDVL